MSLTGFRHFDKSGFLLKGKYHIMSFSRRFKVKISSCVSTLSFFFGLCVRLASRTAVQKASTPSRLTVVHRSWFIRARSVVQRSTGTTGNSCATRAANLAYSESASVLRGRTDTDQTLGMPTAETIPNAQPRRKDTTVTEPNVGGLHRLRLRTSLRDGSPASHAIQRRHADSATEGC